MLCRFVVIHTNTGINLSDLINKQMCNCSSSCVLECDLGVWHDAYNGFGISGDPGYVRKQCHDVFCPLQRFQCCVNGGQ